MNDLCGSNVIDFKCPAYKCTSLFKKGKYEPCIEIPTIEGAQWLSGRVLDLRPRGLGFKPHWRHCIVVLELDTFILA